MSKSVFMLEDDSDDRFFTSETLEEIGVTVPVHFFTGSNDLFAALSAGHKPSLILVDYNATPEDGLQVLKKLKGHDLYKDVPVVILSDNDLSFYRSECYANGASSFVKKPTSLEGTKQKIGAFFKYWLEVAEV